MTKQGERKVVTKEMEEAFKRATAVTQWAVTLLCVFKDSGGEQPVLVDKEMFEILEDALNDG